jgi:hypothetical protein
MAYYLGEGIKDQKARFCGLKNGPKLVGNKRPFDNCLIEAGNSEGILFINYK